MRWRLVAVTEPVGSVEIPSSIDAWLEFREDGRMVAYDGINAMNGDYAVTEAGLEVRPGMVTLQGYGGDDPAQLAAIRAVEALNAGLVTVRQDDDGRLHLQAGEVRLSLDR